MTELDTLFERLIQIQDSKKHPPVKQWAPEREGRIDIRIDRNGQWFHEGTQFRRQSLIELFATILRKDDDGYFLVTPAEKLAIQVEDVPFVVIDLDVRGAEQASELLFTTNVGDYIIANDEHPLEMRNGRPYLMIRDGLEALVNRNVYYRLVEVGIEEADELWVYSQSQRYCLGATS